MTRKSQLISIMFVFSLIALMVLSYLVVNGYVHQLDTIVYTFISSFYQAQVTLALEIITMLGSPTVILALALIMIAVHKDRRETIFVLVSTLLVYMVNQGYRSFIMRAAPTYLHLVDVAGYSFPSQYVSLATIFYGMLLCVLFKRLAGRGTRLLLTILYAVLIILIGISRVYLGVNYFTDVLAGGFLALVCLSVIMLVMEIIKLLVNKNHHQSHSAEDSQ